MIPESRRHRAWLFSVRQRRAMCHHREHLVELRRRLTLHARQDVGQAAESESAAAKVEKTVAALEREEAAMREQMLVP